MPGHLAVAGLGDLPYRDGMDRLGERRGHQDIRAAMYRPLVALAIRTATITSVIVRDVFSMRLIMKIGFVSVRINATTQEERKQRTGNEKKSSPEESS